MDKRILFLLVAFLLSGVITLFAKVGDKAPSSFILPNKEKTEHLLFKRPYKREKSNPKFLCELLSALQRRDS